MATQIILAEDVPNLGVIGDSVQVKPGYARNYLIPQGKAILAGSRQSAELKHHILHLEKKRLGAIASAQAQADALKALSLEVTKKSGPGGRLFGSVTTQEIVQLIGSLGQTIDRRAITLLEPIKTVGTHAFELRLHTEVKVSLTIKVSAEVDSAAASVEKQENPNGSVADETAVNKEPSVDAVQDKK
ncbi:50S ribosomal protein L9 [Deltaproteobacteria bacterium TL4]